jgi:hypothetical protein
MTETAAKRKRPNYGIDAPTAVRNLIVVGAAALVLAVVSPWTRTFHAPGQAGSEVLRNRAEINQTLPQAKMGEVSPEDSRGPGGIHLAFSALSVRSIISSYRTCKRLWRIRHLAIGKELNNRLRDGLCHPFGFAWPLL